MKKYIALIAVILIIGILILTKSSFDQKQIPVIKASSALVDVRDNGVFKKAYWRVSPKQNPDRYISSTKNGNVTFITDLDSISFYVKPNQKFQFIILLNDTAKALTEIVYVPTYLETLQRAAKYNSNDNRPFPKFTYQSADNSYFKSLRKRYNLDSIAGKGDDFSQVVNLMHWLHNLVPHDGNNGNPEIKNAENMISVCKKESRGLNCRGLAMTLNECYLALGFKSRYVTCLPKDSLKIDKDCHVINTVFLNSLKKWIWIDPTFNAYILNENGEPLSIEEVRMRIIDNRPVEVSPGANWNNKNPVVKEDYLFSYMAKNLYILQSPVESKYDTETPIAYQKAENKGNPEYVELLPMDYFRQKPDKIGNCYNTNNPDKFWDNPGSASVPN